MAKMHLRATAIALVTAAFLCLSPHAGFAADPPTTVTVVVSPGDAAPPPDAGRQTVTLTGPFPPVPPPAPKKGSKQAASPPPAPAPAPPPPSTSRAVVASPPPAPRVHKKAKSRESVHGGASRRVADPPLARGGASATHEQRVALVARADSLVSVAPAALDTRTHESIRWVLPVIALLGLLGVLALFAASRLAYWRWAIRRSRRQVATTLDPLPGKRAPRKGYVLYRGTRRWGR
jgi:hypothetical protein